MTLRRACREKDPGDEAMIEALCKWFARAARDLPWRRRRSGYTALVSEIMLQQTQVARVLTVYPRFMRAFPSIRALANAREQQVLAHWQGMGYYRRARNLHAAAKVIVKEHGGRVPRDADSLLRLPGVGRYTAGAIASIVFDQHEPIVDGNVERVLLRVSAKRTKQPSVMRRAAWEMASKLVQQAPRPGVFNEGLMELGATVCLPAPARPRCEACPISGWCKANEQGVQSRIPAVRKRTAQRIEHHHAVVIQRTSDGRLLMHQRPDGGMWARMWQSPTIESDGEMDPTQILAGLRGLGIRGAGPLQRTGGFVHGTTHRSLRFHVFTTRVRGSSGKWVAPVQAFTLPLSNAQKRVLGLAGVGDSPAR